MNQTVPYTFLCSDPVHPVYNALRDWIGQQAEPDRFRLIRKVADIEWIGETLFLVSCSEIVNENTRDRFANTLVFHASDLPKGRGWSPYVWDIINGADHITLCLIEAGDRVDTGRVWVKQRIDVAKTDLAADVNSAMFAAMFDLILAVIHTPSCFTPIEQDASITPTYYAKRTPEDSRIDLDKNLREQYDLIRMCDPVRYPAFFEVDGTRFTIRLERQG